MRKLTAVTEVGDTYIFDCERETVTLVPWTIGIRHSISFCPTVTLDEFGKLLKDSQ